MGTVHLLHVDKQGHQDVRLPPNNDSLLHHIKRTDFITFGQEHYNLLDHPSPINNGWEITTGNADQCVTLCNLCLCI